MSIEAIAERIVADHDLPKTKAREIVSLVLNEIAEASEAARECRLTGFGTFHIVERAAREGRNPRTGEAIAAAKTLRFRPGKALRERLNPETRTVTPTKRAARQ